MPQNPQVISALTSVTPMEELGDMICSSYIPFNINETAALANLNLVYDDRMELRHP